MNLQRKVIFDRKFATVADRDGQVDLDRHAELFAPATVAQKVVAIPQEEKARWDEMRTPTIVPLSQDYR
jgi:hypothetical protein